MRLVHTAYGKSPVNLAVHGPEYRFLVIEEGTSVLVHHYAVTFQCLKAAPVKFLCKKPLGMSERIGSIIYYDIVFIFTAPDKPEAVLIGHLHTFIPKAFSGIREKFLADIHHLFIRLHYIDMLYLRIGSKTAGYSAITATDDENFLYIRMHCHWNMDHHLVVDELIRFREDDLAVKHQEFTERFRLENIYLLKLTHCVIQLVCNTDIQACAFRLRI